VIVSPAPLVVEDVRKAYGPVTALDGLTLDVEPGEIVGLLGANGAGKTTLVSVIVGLVRADAGAVHVFGIDARRDPRRANEYVGFAPQRTAVQQAMTVHENLRFYGELTGLRRRDLARQIETIAGALRLTDLLERRAMRLSGGEQRRVHTAIALLGRPRLLLLDEPTVGADIETRAALIGYVRTLADDGASIVYSTHYLPEVEAMRASVAIVVKGRVIARGTVDDLVRAHGVAVAELTFDGAAPPCCEIEGGTIDVEGGTLRITASDPARAAAAVIARLGAESARLRGIEILHPSLDSVFLALTGRRYDANEPVDVAAA
jgi:ABC-2 type transport system ATP-binding protein